MRQIAVCFCSAVLGGLLTVWLTGPATDSEVAAQVAADPRGPAFAPLQAERPNGDFPSG